MYVNRVTSKSKPENSVKKKTCIPISLTNMVPNFLNKLLANQIQFTMKKQTPFCDQVSFQECKNGLTLEIVLM